MSLEEFKDLALSFPGTISRPHFDRTAFKVEGKRIFATLHEKSESANIILSIPEQEIFCKMNKAVYPVPNKWGTRGWTTFELKKLGRPLILDALNSAYQDVLKKGKSK
ncbi:MAG TPA: MmcQ/YjbR family DNA-binding protein [Hanamia sp.]|nr:MmcQ/YjbR family DNA-binding protein [Hanamia sp.]